MSIRVLRYVPILLLVYMTFSTSAKQPTSNTDVTMTDSTSVYPEAMQRWMEHCLSDEQGAAATIRLIQEGEMDIRGNWTPFTAEGIYEASPLAFEWTAKLKLNSVMTVVASDGHRDGQGWGGAKLWGWIPMGKRTDPEVLTTQLVRNLAELPWVARVLIFNPDMTFTAVNDTSFELHYAKPERGITIRFDVNETGEIVRAWSAFRPYDVPDGYEESPWRVDYSDYRFMNGMRIPFRAVMTFEKEEGEWEYWRGRVVEAKVLLED